MFRVWSGAVILACAALTVVSIGAQNLGGSPEARKLKNPVAATAASLKTGQQLYQKNCMFCHGEKGLGDGKLVPKDMHPANLTDDMWDRGSTDGEIHAVIMNGAGPEFKMKGVKGRLSDADVWNIINYLRSIGPKKTAAR